VVCIVYQHLNRYLIEKTPIMDKIKTEKAYDLHVEHSQWLENLKFYEDEMMIFQNRVSEIAGI